jgi:hypothetical protein
VSHFRSAKAAASIVTVHSKLSRNSNFFPDALTASEKSYLSFPSFYSGWAYQGHIPISDYLRQTGMNRAINGGDFVATPAFLVALHERGFDLDILANTGSAMHNRSELRPRSTWSTIYLSRTTYRSWKCWSVQR